MIVKARIEHFNFLESEDYIQFFISYLQDHVYIKSLSIIKKYFYLKNPELFSKRHFNNLLKNLVRKHIGFIRIVKNLGFVEYYSRNIYKKTKKEIDTEILLKKLIKNEI